MATFEEKLTALESVVDRLERGELTLDDSVRLFEEGINLSNACKSELEAAESKIQVLVEPESGRIRTADLQIETDEDDDEDLDVDDPDDEE
jgi:exodeoxyribonuclease VII small subunit